MDNIDKTMKFDYEEIPKDNVETVLNNVHRTLEERGYNAVNQIVGYLLSGDPAYILLVKMMLEIKFATLIVTLSWKNSFQII